MSGDYEDPESDALDTTIVEWVPSGEEQLGYTNLFAQIDKLIW